MMYISKFGTVLHITYYHPILYLCTNYHVSTSRSPTPGDDAQMKEGTEHTITSPDPQLRTLHIPLHKDNTTEYSIKDLNPAQQAVVICALDTIIKFLNNDPDYKPFRATVVGSGGTGKSFVINTLISLVRKYTQCNNSVKVAAPSGGAAYNVQGCTLHRCLSLSVDTKALSKPLPEERQYELAKQLTDMLMLIIDERSMLNSKLIAAAERNIRHCVYGQQNQKERWGGVPVVLLFGDDYQLFPVIETGAIEGFHKRNSNHHHAKSYKEGSEQLLQSQGNDLFIDDLTDNVFTLTENYRTIQDPVFGEILERLRIGRSTEDDAARLVKQALFHQSRENQDKILNDKKTVFLFTKNILKNHKNQQKLVELSNSTKTPVARLRCQWIHRDTQSRGIKSITRAHFKDIKKLVLQGDYCVGAPVSIEGMNIVPEAGLYNGARGWLVDIVYDTVEGPNNKMGSHLPLYMVVDFPGLRLNGAKPWDADHPTVSCYTVVDVYQKVVI